MDCFFFFFVNSALFTANVLLLALMSALAPSEWNVVIKRMDRLRDTPSETYGHCQYGHEQSPYLVALAVINLSILVCAMAQAWQARNLSTEFAESQYIFRALLSFLMVLFTCGPVLVMTQENPNIHVFAGSSIVFIWSTVSLLWIFVPKIQFHRHQKKPPRGGSVMISGLAFSQPQGSTADPQHSNSDGTSNGERILSWLPMNELIRENESLRRELEALRACRDDDEAVHINGWTEESAATVDRN